MQLTYRGISYNYKSTTATNPQVNEVEAGSTLKGRSTFDCLHKYRLSEKSDSNKVAWLRPITYLIYRGVSYTKRPLSNAKTQLLQ